MNDLLVDKHSRIAAVLEEFRAEISMPASALPQEVAQAVHFIHHHVFDPELNVSRVKAGCGFRNHNFSTRFKVAVGTGMRSYIEALRMRAADRLLIDGDLEVYLVGVAVGYGHPETFCRAFRRHFGCPPLARHRSTGGGDRVIGEALSCVECEAQPSSSRSSRASSRSAVVNPSSKLW